MPENKHKKVRRPLPRIQYWKPCALPNAICVILLRRFKSQKSLLCSNISLKLFSLYYLLHFNDSLCFTDSNTCQIHTHHHEIFLELTEDFSSIADISPFFFPIRSGPVRGRNRLSCLSLPSHAGLFSRATRSLFSTGRRPSLVP